MPISTESQDGWHEIRKVQGGQAGALWASSHPDDATVRLSREARRAATHRGIRVENGRTEFVAAFKAAALKILRG
jgi:hypothetical protein